MIRLYLWTIMLIVIAAPVSADELRPGYLEFTQKSAREWTLVWKSPFTGGFTSLTKPELPGNCMVRGVPARKTANAAIVTTTSLICIGHVEGRTIGLTHFDTAQSDVLVRVAPLGRRLQTLRLTPAEPRQVIAAQPGRWQVARTYFLTGTDHILFGYDHLLFVVALVLLLSGAWIVFKAVTAFTIAHSITLVGTTLGFIGLPQRPVEIVIALSIMFLAVEILKRQPNQPRLSERIPWVVSFGFGLLHGFGFAGALQEIGLPENEVPMALLTFNLGVEAGQLAIVATTMSAIFILRRRFANLQAPFVRLATYAIGITASFWFIQRSFS